MAVSVDTVYQRVLALANKEQRGYITPQEFNLLANQAQSEIFEQYFYDLNQFHRNPGNDGAASDSVDDIEDKISIFQVYNFSLTITSGNNVILPHSASAGYPAGTDEMYRLEEVRHNDNICAQVTPKKMHLMKKGVFAAQPLLEHPVYIRQNNAIQVYHLDASGGFTPIFGSLRCDYIRKPKKCIWNYVVVNEKALYNASNSVDFELHPAEETSLVYKILELSGIVINKPGLSSYGKTESVEGDNTRKS
jgi:hypothetical protein